MLCSRSARSHCARHVLRSCRLQGSRPQPRQVLTRLMSPQEPSAIRVEGHPPGLLQGEAVPEQPAKVGPDAGHLLREAIQGSSGEDSVPGPRQVLRGAAREAQAGLPHSRSVQVSCSSRGLCQTGALNRILTLLNRLQPEGRVHLDLPHRAVQDFPQGGHAPRHHVIKHAPAAPQ